MKKNKLITVIISCALVVAIGLSLIVFIPHGSQDSYNFTITKSSGNFASSPTAEQERVYCGSDGIFAEKYFNESQSAQTTQLSGSVCARACSNPSGYFTYNIPVDKNTKAPLRISLRAYGEFSVSADGTQVFNTGALANDFIKNQISYEFELTDKSLWQDGEVEIKFASSGTATQTAFGVYWFEFGTSSLWRDRLSRIEWDTSDVVWQMGYYDGNNREFNGAEKNTFSPGENIKLVNTNSKVEVTWDQQPKKGSKYYLLVGFVNINENRDNSTNKIDMNADGTFEYDKYLSILSDKHSGERIVDLDITKYVANGQNKAVLVPANNGFIDFAAVVEVTDGYTRDEDLRVKFKGGDSADSWTKLINSTLYWHLDYFTDETSGFMDASFPNGLFPGLDWIADVAPGTEELAKWGYFDEAKVVTLRSNSARNILGDNGASALMNYVETYLMRGENYNGGYSTMKYPDTATGLKQLANEAERNDNNLILGSNSEASGGQYAIYNNSVAMYALEMAVEMADKREQSDDYDIFVTGSETLRDGLTKNLLISRSDNPAGLVGTWQYSVNASGVQGPVNAGWLSIGATESIFYGLRANSSQNAAFREAVDKTLSYHSSKYWKNWKLYGNNRGYGTSYGVLSERGGWPLTSMLLSDRIDMVEKNVEHLAWNSADLNFSHDNEGMQETGPWLLIRETSGVDNGIASKGEIGNTPSNEDMNLVEYAVTLKNGRVMAGVDDSLYNNSNFAIIPRIPDSWTGVMVNKYPVQYRDGKKYAQTNVSYDYNLTPTSANITMLFDDSIDDTEVRFGPFSVDQDVSSVKIDGRRVKYTVEDSGGYRWIWVKTNVKANRAKYAQVEMSSKNVVLYEAFDDNKITQLSQKNGNFTCENGMMKADTKELSYNLSAKSITSGSVRANVMLKDLGTAGVAIFADGKNSGYQFVVENLGILKNADPQKVSDQSDKSYVETDIIKLQTADGKVLASEYMNFCENREYTMKITVENSVINCYLDSVLLFSCTDSSFTKGAAGVVANGLALFDNVLVNSANPAYKIQSIDFTNNLEISLVPDQSRTVDVRAFFENGQFGKIDTSEVTFESEDESVCEFDNFVITALSQGETTIKATVVIDDTEYVATQKVKVYVTPSGTQSVLEDFSNGFNYSVTGDATAEAENEALNLNASGTGYIALADVKNNFTFSADINKLSGDNAGIGYITEENGQLNGYAVYISKVQGRFTLVKYTNGSESVLMDNEVSADTFDFINIKMEVFGDRIVVYSDARKALEYQAVTGVSQTGKLCVIGVKSQALVDNIIVYER